jgi:hypothetical protein
MFTCCQVLAFAGMQFAAEIYPLEALNIEACDHFFFVIHGYLWRAKHIQEVALKRAKYRGGTVSKSAATLTKVVGAASLLFVGYVFLTALPDLRRYIKISMM